MKLYINAGTPITILGNHTIHSGSKSLQLGYGYYYAHNYFNWGKPLPIAVVSHPYVKPNYIPGDGLILLAFENHSTEIIGNLEIICPEINLSESKIEKLDDDGFWKDVRGIFKAGMYARFKSIRIDINLLPYTMTIYRVKQ